MSLEKMRRKCQQLNDEESMAILQKATAGTLALLCDNDYPYAVPISYAYREGKLYFHIALGGIYSNLVKHCIYAIIEDVFRLHLSMEYNLLFFYLADCLIKY